MWATYWDAFAEAGGRRAVVTLLIMALLAGWMFASRVTFGVVNGVGVIYQGPLSMVPWVLSVPVILGQMAAPVGVAWMLLMIFSGCPQFVSMLERGWRELTFSKGARRWQILLGRYLSTTSLFFVITLISTLPLAIRLWWHTGIPTWQVGVGVLIQTVGFASLLAIGALVSLAGEGVAGPIIAPVGVLVVTQLILSRGLLYAEGYITSRWARTAIDWLYYVLPKCWELNNTAAAFIQSQTIPSSWPLWTTSLFAVATVTLTLWLLERRSF